MTNLPQNRPLQDGIGTIIAERYKLIKLIGSGGMGRVYLAEQVMLRSHVAIKVLKSEFSRDSNYAERFLREARAASRINHENVVKIFDLGITPEGSVFFAMEYLDGEDLSQILAREGKLPWERVRPLALQIARGLKAAHVNGVIHRDLKPANCFLTHRDSGVGCIKIVDFGIAKISDATEDGLTRTGSILGTAYYMSPEQCSVADSVDERTDVYSLGITLYKLLTGETPFKGNVLQVASQHLNTPPPFLRQVAPDAGIPEAAEQIVLKMLAKRKEDRIQSMAELEQSLLVFDGLPSPAPLVKPKTRRATKTGVHDSEFPETMSHSRVKYADDTDHLDADQQALSPGSLRPWQRKSRYIAAGTIFGLLVAAGVSAKLVIDSNIKKPTTSSNTALIPQTAQIQGKSVPNTSGNEDLPDPVSGGKQSDTASGKTHSKPSDKENNLENQQSAMTVTQEDHQPNGSNEPARVTPSGGTPTQNPDPVVTPPQNTTTAESEREKLLKSIHAGQRKAKKAAEKCKQNMHIPKSVSIEVEIEFNSNGYVSDASVVDSLHRDMPIVPCIESAARAYRIEPGKATKTKIKL